jgi:hypothetical protein
MQVLHRLDWWARSAVHSVFSEMVARLHRHRWSIVSCVMLSLMLTVVSIRDFLFGSGFFEYADQQWAPNGSVYPTGYFAPTPLTSTGYFYPLQFTRDFIAWPLGIFHSLGLDSLLQEKLFYLYSFCLFVVLSYILSALIVRYTLRVLRAYPAFWKQEVVRVFITIMMFTNLYFLYLNVDGGTVTTSLVAIFLGISLVFLVAEPDFGKALSVTVILNSLGFLLDPSNAITVVLTIGVALLLRSVMNRGSLRTLVIQFGELVVGFGGTLLFLLYLFYPTLGAGPLSSDFPVRAFNLASIQYFAMNTTLANVLRFTGYSWTTLTFAPPAILGYSGAFQSLPGQQSPATVLLLPDAISQAWLLSLFAPVAIALSSLAVRRLRRITLPFAGILLTCVGVTQWPWFSPSAQAVTALASLPAVGPLIGEALYFPYFFILGEAVAVIILVGALLTALIGWVPAGPVRSPTVDRVPPSQESAVTPARSPYWLSRSRYPREELRRWAVVGIVAILMVLPGWQAIDGSYFPSRSWPTYVGGNGVPNAGPYEPVQLPEDVREAYNYLYHQPGNFNIYWPTGGANETNTQRGAFFFDAYDAPKPMASLPALPGLVAQGATGALTAYLQAQDVRYLVLQNTSPVSLQLFDYGLSNFAALRMFFDGLPGLMPALSFPNLTVYQVSGTWGTIYPVSSILSYNGSSSTYSAAYAVGAGLHAWPSLVSSPPANQTLSIDNLSGSESVLSPGFLNNYSGLGTVAKPTLSIPVGSFTTAPVGSYANFSAVTGNLSLNLVQRAGTVMTIANWSLIDWGPANVSVHLTNGSIEWTAQGPATVTASFGPSLTSGPGGIEIVHPGPASLVTSLALHYRTSSNFGGSLSAYLVNEPVNTTSGTVAGLTLLSPNSSGQPMEFNAPTISWTHYFTTRFQAVIDSGSINVSQVNYSWNLPSLHFLWNVSGNYQSLGGWSLLNWSSQGLLSYGFSDGNLSWNASAPTTVSLSFGPPLVDGPGGVPNPSPGTSGVSASMTLRYRTSPGFQGTIGMNGYFQPSTSPTAGALATSGPTLPLSSIWREVAYSTTLPPSTRNFTIRLQATAFTGEIQLSNVTFSWALLPVVATAPFGVVLQSSRNQTVTFPGPVSGLYASLKGPPPPGAVLLPSANDSGGFEWYRFTGSNIPFQSGDLVAVVVVMTHPLPGSPVGTVYTGPFAVDLVLVSGDRQYRPYETLDSNALFLFTGSGSLAIEHSAIADLAVYYLLFLIYLALFYPVLVWLRRRFRPIPANPPNQGLRAREPFHEPSQALIEAPGRLVEQNMNAEHREANHD